MPEGNRFSLERTQAALREAGVDGWLFYDFRGSDPIARKILGFDAARITTRRWFYYVPARGEATALVHAIESGVLDHLPGRRQVYLTWQSLDQCLAELLAKAGQVAMQYSPENCVPYLSRVDAGTLEQVRATGCKVVSSADLVQRFDATLTDGQFASHERAAVVLRALIDEVFSEVVRAVTTAEAMTERRLLEFLEGRLRDAGLVFDHSPIVAVNEHAADPHFEVPPNGSQEIREGDLLLVDVWAREPQSGGIFADITWTAFVGREAPEEMRQVFSIVRDAREAAVTRARQAFQSDETVQGYELDRVARKVIDEAGFGQYFIHRTGHSIHEEGHGNGANLDDLETHDTRTIIPRTLFSVEPGIYLPGRFGIRSEVNVFHSGSDAVVTGPTHQDELRGLLA